MSEGAMTESGRSFLVRLVRRFAAEGVDLRTSTTQVMKAARLGAEEAGALYEAVRVAEAEDEGNDVDGAAEQEERIARRVPADGLPDASEGADDWAGPADEDDRPTVADEAMEEPDPESFRGTVRVVDFAEARRAGLRVLERDRLHPAPERRVLDAEQEVGLFLLLRGERTPSEPLPADYAARLPEGGEAYRAFSALLAHNQKLVHKILQSVPSRDVGCEYDDLVQHGMLGLIRAVQKFDISLGCKFSTYATWWVRQSITRGWSEEGFAIRIPVHAREMMEKVRRAERTLVAEGLIPGIDALVSATALSPKKVEFCLGLLGRRMHSLDEPVGEGIALGEWFVDELPQADSPERALRPMFARQEIFQLFEACGLTGRSRYVVLRRWGCVDGECSTLEQLGGELGVSRERVRQIESRAFKDMQIVLGLAPDEPQSARRRRRAVRSGERTVAGAGARKRRGEPKRTSTSPAPRGGNAFPDRTSRSIEREGAVTSKEESRFGQWLAERMHDRGMDDNELAGHLETPRALVEAWLTGRSEPRPEMKERVREVLLSEGASLRPATGAPAQQDRGNMTTSAVWYHRPGHDDGGREFGNAAAFAFEADLEVLAREATQNSLDERFRGNDRPVRVRYTLNELTGEALERFRDAIGWTDLHPHFEAAADQDQKVGRVIRAGLREVCERGRLLLLRVDDYNANGLTGDDYEDGRFAAVVRRQLDSHKTDATAGGSYGLGKATLWATSRLGLVLINSTLSEPHEGCTERRLIGRLELPWREVEGERFAGPAWLGQPDHMKGNPEVVRSWWADEATVERLHLARDGAEPGTSFLIVGAHDVASLVGEDPESGAEEDEESLERMHTRLVRALGRNFWAAMTTGGDHRPLLEASVRTLRNGVEHIEEEPVDPHAHQPARARALQAFLSGTTVDRLTEAGQVAMATVPLKVPERDGESGTGGEHRAVLLVTEATDADGKINRVTAMRGNRMTVTTKWVPGLPAGTNPFQAVLLAGRAAGDVTPFAAEAEEFLRASEPPEHNKWGQTDELRMRYSPSSHRRIAALTTATNKAVLDIVAVRKEKRPAGMGKVKKNLKIPHRPSSKAKGPTTPPQLDGLEAVIATSGAWEITAEVKVPHGGAPCSMIPVAKLEVRSGPRPLIKWAELVAVKDCEVEDGVLRFPHGGRRAVFRGVTDVATQPVRGALTGLVVELQESRGGRA
ncbi:sigma-70 family RNA polymerase sigma factor [Streptomyces boncukensis]